VALSSFFPQCTVRSPREGVEEDLSDVAAAGFGAGHRPVVGECGQQGAVLGEDPLFGAADVDDRPVLVHQIGFPQRELPIVFVQVELAALGPGTRVCVCVVDGDVDAVEVQDPGEGEAAKSGPDDGD
jgi:hypothetical protein